MRVVHILAIFEDSPVFTVSKGLREISINVAEYRSILEKNAEISNISVFTLMKVVRTTSKQVFRFYYLRVSGN